MAQTLSRWRSALPGAPGDLWIAGREIGASDWTIEDGNRQAEPSYGEGRVWQDGRVKRQSSQTRTTRRHLTRKEKAELLREHRRSGRSLLAFAGKHGLCYSSILMPGQPKLLPEMLARLFLLRMSLRSIRKRIRDDWR